MNRNKEQAMSCLELEMIDLRIFMLKEISDSVLLFLIIHYSGEENLCFIG